MVTHTLKTYWNRLRHSKDVFARARGHLLLVAAAAVVILVVTVLIYNHYRHHVETDDAQIAADIYPIVSRVAGYVAEVPVDDNQNVELNALLVRIDPRDLEAKRDSLSAGLERAQAALSAAEAKTQAAKATRAKARSDLVRYKAMAQNKEISAQEYDAARATADALEAQYQAAEHETNAAQAAVAEKEAELALTDLQLSYTRIVSPVRGGVTQKIVKNGQYIEPGQALMAIVDTANPWIVANFKETQVKRLAPGQAVRIKVDAYPDAVFSGHVDSIQRGTGAQFSLLPPENATGNFVKIVQRVPVKIVFDSPPPSRYLLAPGMSVIPEVKVP